MDLEAIPGLTELWALTQGDPRILVGIMDGVPDLAHACFKGADVKLMGTYWLEDDRKPEDFSSKHATHITSVIFGQPGTEVRGLAPRCRGVVLPAGIDSDSILSELHMAMAFDTMAETGAQLIHCALCLPSQTGQVGDLWSRSVAHIVAQNRMIVSPAGNDHGTCYCSPATMPGVLTAGAISDEGRPMKFTNWGGANQVQGLMLSGENVLGAKPGGGTVRQKGTSVAAPILSGLVALLMSLLIQEGREPRADLVREALLETALPCSGEDAEKCLMGVINLPGAVDVLLGRRKVTPRQRLALDELPPASPLRGITLPPTQDQPEEAAEPSEVQPAAAPPPSLVYALGQLHYDFGTEVCRDAFAQALGGDPEDRAAMLAHLTRTPDEARKLVWTLSQDGAPLYAIRPRGAYAAEVYDLLTKLLENSLLPASDPASVDRMSLPGWLSQRKAELLSGEELPVVLVGLPRGMYGWSTAHLVNDTLPGEATPELRSALQSMLDRVYTDLHNPGVLGRQRALNFAVTNIYQAVDTLSQAVKEGFQLEQIEVLKSPFCRPQSECWDLQLRFVDPEREERAYRAYRFTIDVRDEMPVTVGPVRTWSVAR